MAFPADYTLLRKIPIDATAVTGSNNAFVGLITEAAFKLSKTFIFANTDNGGGDVRLSTDQAGLSQISIDVVGWDTSGETCQVWYLADGVDSVSPTDLYIWGDNTGDSQPAVGAAFGRNSVWVNKKRANHLDSASLIDSAGDSDLTINAGALSTVTGPFGTPVADFNGSTSLLSSNAVVAATSSMSMSVWLLRDTAGSAAEAAPFGTTIKAADETEFGTRYDLAGFATGNANCWKSSIKDTTQESSANSSLGNTWQLMDLVRDGTTARLYIDGAEDVNWTISAADLSANHMYIGIGTKSTSSWRGAICESIIEYDTYTPDFVATKYSNQNDVAGFYLEPVEVSGGISIAVVMNQLRNQGIN